MDSILHVAWPQSWSPRVKARPVDEKGPDGMGPALK